MEGCVNSGLFTFTLPQPLPDTQIFYYTIGGSAISGTDYVPFQDSIIMPAGQITVTVPVTIIPDNISEGPESIFVFYTDSTLCNNFIYRDTAEMVIWDKPQIPPLPDIAFCSGATVSIGFPIQPDLANFTWSPAIGLSSDTVSFPQLTLFNPSGPTSDTSFYIMEVEAFQGYCLWQDTMQVLVHPANYADFVADTVCFGNTTSFTASTVFDQLTSVQWSFGDGQNGGGIQTAHTYGQDGSFNVQILTQNSKGCRDTLIKPILIDSLPVASFFVDPVCQNSPSAFANDVRPGTSYVWTFGDGTNSILPLPTHVYDTFGVYQVLVVATSARGCVDSLRREAQVFANPQPSFTADAECLGTPTRFINETTSNSGAAVSYGWGFGDGGISSQISPVHLYNSYGIKNVTLTAIDINGCSGQYAAPVRVYALPVANFTSDSVCAGDNIVFRNQSVVPDGFDISQTLWNFGDGRISGAVQPDIPFSQPGLYTVELKVVTVHGCPDSTTRVVAIHPNPVVDFRKTDVCALDSAQFNNDSRI
ncbi:MAG: PKD domain-containing protein, partial [Bacteroidetes bacterium]